MIQDSVFKEKGKWFFWDETWSFEYGPYETEKEARAKLALYLNWINSGKME